MKKIFAVLGVLALCGFTAFVATISPIKQVGPFYTAATAFDSTSAGQVGGHVRTYLAADSLRIGQVVYLSAKNTVNKSATLANYNALIGVVCGGVRTGSGCSTSVSDTSTLAATANQKVFVVDRGRVWVLLDTAAGQSPGMFFVPSVKSNMGGRAAPKSSIIDTVFRVFGKSVDSAVSGKAVLMNINVK